MWTYHECYTEFRIVDNVYYRGEGWEGEMCGHSMNTILKSEMWTMRTTKEKEGRHPYVDKVKWPTTAALSERGGL